MKIKQAFIDQYPKEDGWYWMWGICNNIISYKPNLYYVCENGDGYRCAKTIIDDASTVTIVLGGEAPAYYWYGPVEFPRNDNIFDERIPCWFPLIKPGQKVLAWDTGCKEDTHMNGEYIAYIEHNNKHLICREFDETYGLYDECELIENTGELCLAKNSK